MKNTLKIALMIIGIAVIGFGLYTLIFAPASSEATHETMIKNDRSTQALAMMAFGVLCLISGIAFRRR